MRVLILYSPVLKHDNETYSFIAEGDWRDINKVIADLSENGTVTHIPADEEKPDGIHPTDFT